MTEYLTKCGGFMAQASTHVPALYYILEEYHSDPDIKNLFYDGLHDRSGEKVLQMLFDKSPIKMRMYGSAKDLAENIKIYTNFPNSHRYFDIDDNLFTTTPIIQKSLKNENFICKLDLFPTLQSMLFRCVVEYDEPIHVLGIIEPLLKFELNRLMGQPEFVRFDQKVLDEIWSEIQTAHETIHRICDDTTEFKKLKAELKSLHETQLIKKLKSYVPNNWDEVNMYRIDHLLMSVLKDLCNNHKESQSVMMAMLFTKTKVLSETLQKVINTRPELFLPRSATGKGPVTVRLFEDSGHQFVMKMELFNAIKESSNGKIQIDYVPEELTFDTMKMEDVLQQFGDKINGIDFIRYPINRAKHRAVPVNGPNPTTSDLFSILAVDALLETFRIMTMELRTFQKFQHGKEFEWKSVSKSLERVFKETESPYFIACPLVDALSGKIKDNLNGVYSIPAKNVRNAKTDGFTLQNLKNELAHLNLLVTFPEIQDYAEVVYEHVNRVKKERYLRTCDLFDAIENCQLICMLERMPNLKKFLHNQGGCGRVVGLQCQFCMDEQKTSEILEPQNIQSPNSTLTSIESSTSNALEQSSAVVKTEMEEKLSKLEQELVQKNKEIEELRMGNVMLTAENDTKSGIIEKLMDKLSIGSSSKSSVTVVEKPITCIICQGEIEGQMTIDCPMCSTKFHKKCALQYGQHQTKCPACNGEIVKFIC